MPLGWGASENVRVVTATLVRLPELAAISIAFEVKSVLDVSTGPGGIYCLTERKLGKPYWKDYDALPGNHPLDWPARFDLRNWGLLFAEEAAGVTGACLLAWNTPGVDMLEGRADLAVLWDLRVAPPRRGQGVGTALFKAALAWTRERGARELKVETQNNNVPAVRFYLRMGCVLRSAIPGAYPELPEETMLLFYIRVRRVGFRSYHFT